MIAAKILPDMYFLFFCDLTHPIVSVFLATFSRTVLVPFQRSSGVTSSCAASSAVNLLVTMIAPRKMRVLHDTVPTAVPRVDTFVTRWLKLVERKLHCFLFIEFFLEIQRRNAVLSLSYSQPDF